MKLRFIAALWIVIGLAAGCAPAETPAAPAQAPAAPAQAPAATAQAPAAPAPANPATLKVLAVESFLADLAQNVAGERLQVETLIPLGLDPHAFEPTPQDVAHIAKSTVLIANGSGIEEWLEETLSNAGGQRQVIEASAGLKMRQPQPGEHAEDDHPGEQEHAHEGDPHFWFDPSLAIHYVENIRDGLSQADPAGREVYARNATAYIEKLKELDSWIETQIAQVPPEHRLLVTNHESFGYFADRYGLRIVGTVLPSTSSLASPSAAQMAALTEAIRASRAQAIFIETGANPELASQIAEETGAQMVSDLYTHSLSQPGGPAATYLDMMRYNTGRIVAALK